MDLTSDDKHNMQLDPTYIPRPITNDRLSSTFYFPVGMDIACASSFITRFALNLRAHSQLPSDPGDEKAPPHSERQRQSLYLS